MTDVPSKAARLAGIPRWRRPTLAALAVLGALSLAPIPAHAGATAAIEADRAAGLITDHEARMQTFAVVFAPERLATEYAALGVDDAPPCATTLVSDLKLHWDELTPDFTFVRRTIELDARSLSPTPQGPLSRNRGGKMRPPTGPLPAPTPAPRVTRSETKNIVRIPK